MSPVDTDRSPFPTIPDALRHWAGQTPERLALTAGAVEVTYAKLGARVSECIATLHSRGVQPGDRVILAGQNTIEWVAHYLAVLAMGAVAAPTNTRLSTLQFSHQAELLDAALVLVDRHYESLTELVPDRKVLRLRKTPGSVTVTSAHLPSPDPDLPGLVSFTSGTTGVPKGATLSHGALTEASWAFATVLGTTSADSTLVMVPLFHNTGFVDQLGHMLLVGGRTDLLREFHTKQAVEALAARPTTFVTAVPSIIRLIMLAEGADAALSSVRILLYGGSPMPAAWSLELHEKYPGLDLFHGYGLTEYGSAVSVLPPEYVLERGESIGFPVPGTTLRIVDDAGVDVPDAATGELWVHGPTIMQGYWREPELTAAKITDGWLRTGDLARQDVAFLYLEGRVDDVINRGGEKVLPSYVESLLATRPDVAQSSVFGVPDRILQQRVWAAIEERPGTQFDEVAARRSLSQRLPDYAVPERIHVLNPLPRTGSGKVDRRAVAAHFTQQLASTGPEGTS